MTTRDGTGPGTLYVVATPIGNLGDLSARASAVLREAGVIAAESPRNARPLLSQLGVTTRPVAYNDRNKARSQGRLLTALRAGRSVALISDAGTPGVSDPGQDLVAAAVAAGATVVPVPGASAATALLSVAGVRTRTVRLLGFLPRKRGERRALLASLGEGGEPGLAFESRRRVAASLSDVAAVLPDASLVVGRELTKLHEEIWRGGPADAVAHFATGGEAPRGEFTLLIVPAAGAGSRWSEAAVRSALRSERAAGRSRREASVVVAARSGWGRSEVYRLWEG